MVHSCALASSVEFLPFKSSVRVPGPASILRLGACPLSVLSCAVSGSGPDILLTTDPGKSAFLYQSSVLVNSMCSS